MKQTTLAVIIKDEKILLCMKKRGFGEWFWNWAGWKLEKWETIEEAMIRELEEETGLKTNLDSMETLWVLQFRFLDKADWNQDVNVFKINSWQNEPIETEEMLPKWFNISEIPYDMMWEDDKIWLPKVIAWEKIEFEFQFLDGKLVNHKEFTRAKLEESKLIINNWYKKIFQNFYSLNSKVFNVLIYGGDKSDSWTMLVPILDNWNILYLREYRYWPDEFIYNFPVWKQEPELTSEENIAKELKEETWCVAEKFEYLWETIVWNYSWWKLKYFLAKNVKKAWNQELEEPEQIEVIESIIEDFEKLIQIWAVKCPLTITAFYLAKSRL